MSSSPELNTSRRQLLKLAGITGGGLILGVPLSGCSSSPYPNAAQDAWQADAFLQVTGEGTVRFLLPQAEMGQGVIMGLTTVIAEELNMSPALVEVEVAGVHKDYQVPGIGLQITGGSASVRTRYDVLRQSAATTRHLLLQAAAQQWQAPLDKLALVDGKISFGDQSDSIGAFVAVASTLPIPENVTLTKPENFRWVGKDNLPRIDALAKVTGGAEFGLDVEIPNLKRAAVKRCPVIGGTVKSFTANGADKQSGVHHVVEIFNGVAVLADHYWQARKAVDTIDVQWDYPPLVQASSSQIEQQFADALSQEGLEAHQQGDVSAASVTVAQPLSARYYAPYLAHATMEPMNCVVHLQGDKAELWAPTQAPGLAQQLVSEYSGIARERITVHTTFLGGGFGRRAFHDFVAEATSIAKATGEPVQLVWSREDDMQNDYYRPASMVEFNAGLDTQGQLQTWSVKRVGPNIMPYTLDEALGVFMPGFIPQGIVEWASKRGYGVFDHWAVDSASVEGLFEDYTVANKEVRHVTVDPGLRCGYWRSVGHSFTGFFVESFMDELAHSSGQDALAFRLRHMPDNPRLKRVLEAAAEKAGWGKTQAPGRFLGLAAVSSFESFVAQVAEISIDNGAIKVHKVTCAVDCGRVINPDIVRTQMEGGIIFGLTAALLGDITVSDGAVQQSNFHDYPLLRMNESPLIDVVLINSDEPPTGVGEPGLPPIAPAVANAIFAATGKRLRRLPLTLA